MGWQGAGPSELWQPREGPSDFRTMPPGHSKAFLSSLIYVFLMLKYN